MTLVLPFFLNYAKSRTNSQRTLDLPKQHVKKIIITIYFDKIICNKIRYILSYIPTYKMCDNIFLSNFFS